MAVTGFSPRFESSDAVTGEGVPITPQTIYKKRRDYNRWVANETLEDYALRFTPHAFRKWSVFRVANTALGATSFLVLEAIGATLAVSYGFENAFWAVAVASLLIFITSLPISYFAAEHGLDMDLLTRGAGFGYIGSTISSFVYASFTFILFALEAAIMAYALNLFFELPIYVLYLLCALVVLPFVIYGVTLISRVQMLTQPVWLVLMLLPVIVILLKEPNAVHRLMEFGGASGYDNGFNIYMFGAAMAVAMALIPQVGEQVDYLRFMPKRSRENRFAWHFGVLASGPGWIVIGMLKMMIGMLLAMLMIEGGGNMLDAVNPTLMYQLGFGYVFESPEVVLMVTVIFVVVSQLKINMTNAYAGSLAWSNFFARLTHNHPGRVVWLIFNVSIACLLMMLEVSQAIEQVLGLYSNVAIAWVTAVVADLVINKPLGLSPPGIEFRRAYLYDINPVGVGSMGIACVLSVAAYVGVFGLEAKTFSSFIALGAALVSSPLIALATRGKYYLARKPFRFSPTDKSVTCTVCEQAYESQDIAMCPAYNGPICSLCCCLDARCDDACKPSARLGNQWSDLLRGLLPASVHERLPTSLGSYLLLMTFTLVLLSSVFFLVYMHAEAHVTDYPALVVGELRAGFLRAFFAMSLIGAVIVWWLVLNAQSRRLAQQESLNQNSLLQKEIRQHQITDIALQRARVAAEDANHAKSRFITGVSHELRTPLNSILGYAQLMQSSTSLSEKDARAAGIILRSGEHLLSLIDGTMDISKIETGRLEFDLRPLSLPAFLEQIRNMFEIQGANKRLKLDWRSETVLPSVVRADSKRLGQILINIIGNALKFTEQGSVSVEVGFARDFLNVVVTDTGVGIPSDELERIFQPFVRGSRHQQIGGTGLGLTISKLLVELMGGELSISSRLDQGTRVRMRLFLPELNSDEASGLESPKLPVGYRGKRRTLMVVDNEPVDRQLLADFLEPLGFTVHQADSGEECIRVYPALQPDLIILDLAMPGMDGWETCHVIRNVQGAKVPLAILSANAFDRKLENNVGIGREEFFTKPLDFFAFVAWLGPFLGVQWIYEHPIVVADGDALPDGDALAALCVFIELGNLSSIRRSIKAFKEDTSISREFVSELERYSEALQLEALMQFVQKNIKND